MRELGVQPLPKGRRTVEGKQAFMEKLNHKAIKRYEKLEEENKKASMALGLDRNLLNSANQTQILSLDVSNEKDAIFVKYRMDVAKELLIVAYKQYNVIDDRAIDNISELADKFAKKFIKS